MKLIKPDGSSQYIHDGEQALIAHLLDQGYSRVGDEPQSGSHQNAELHDAEPLNPSSVNVAVIKQWLATDPALSDVAVAYQMEAADRHRKTALDALQDYMSDV